MKLGIVGSREFNDYDFVEKNINIICGNIKISEIVSGGARGVDSIAEQYAKDNNIKTRIFEAEWDWFGKRAGFVRNEYIVDYSDYVIAFWDGVSTGTKDTINMCMKKKKNITVIFVK